MHDAKPRKLLGILGRRKIDDVLHLRHHRHLVIAVEQVHALALRAHLVAVEVGGALLELGEVLDRTKGTLGAVDLLVEQAPQTGGINPEPIRLRADIRRQVESRVGVKVGVTIQASHAAARLSAFAILGLIEFLLRERGEQKPQPFDLHGGKQTDHEIIIVFDG